MIKKGIYLVVGGLALIFLISGTIDLNDLLNYKDQPVPDHVNTTGLDNVPIDNPMSDTLATLGRVLFYDKQLSSNNKVACASCHLQSNAFGSPLVVDTGVNGLNLRHAMRLGNIRYSESTQGFFWDERDTTLEQLATHPIQNHIEMGYSGELGDPTLLDLITKMNGLSYYPLLFQFAYGDPTITEERIQKALANFLRSIQSFDSKFDEGLNESGGNDPLVLFSNFSSEENAGKTLFFSDPVLSGINRVGGGVGCFHCHSDVGRNVFHFLVEKKNNGIITEVDGSTVFNVTKAPNLRNVFGQSGELNGPLFHNGQASTFNQLLDHYDTAALTSNPNLDTRITSNGKLNLTSEERAQLESFMKTLTGNDIYLNPKWSNPFDADGNPLVSPDLVYSGQEMNVSLFPNPASEYIYLSGDISEISEIVIYSMNGHEVWRQQLISNRLSISSLSTGMYFVVFVNESGQNVALKKIYKD
ncbi:MAG: T9SS type A sorting domain-containing protein [Chitinophagales bacterium]|nr:T9SS type A sorting domain-containing protein [Chitinophagales bacterium]HRX23386.1 cytochrome c peroxidase [Chitinophagales bacterium]